MEIKVIGENKILEVEITEITKNSWASYERRKLIEGSDPFYFNCRSAWEIDYLVGKICGIYPKYTERNSRRAVNIICLSVAVHSKRTVIVKHVMGVLQLL